MNLGGKLQKSQSCWYAVYTKPRWEKKLRDVLTKKGIENYCPLNRVRKKWSDRYKTIEEPLFKSYLFVRLLESQLQEIRFIDGVINFVYWLGKPAIIKQEDIERIQKFLGEYAEVEVRRLSEGQIGDKVLVTQGAFMDQEGTILSINNKTVEIIIESLGYKLVAYLDKGKIMVKESKK